jgi:aromatic ring hydroxylase
VKNDQMLRPGEQPNPDAYVHIKERLKDGIAVSGCKVHI